MCDLLQDRELHKLKSVLQQASTLMSSNSTKNDGQNLLLSTIQEHHKVNISGNCLICSVSLIVIHDEFVSCNLCRENRLTFLSGSADFHRLFSIPFKNGSLVQLRFCMKILHIGSAILLFFLLFLRQFMR